MEYFFFDLLLSPFGWFILLIKYRDRKKIKAIIKSEYDDNYSNVAKSYIFSVLLLFFALLILILICVTLVKTFLGEDFYN